MKVILYLVVAVFIASFAFAHDTPPPIDECFVHVAHPPASCEGGEIIQDEYDSCRVVVCSDNESSLSVMACGKPDNAAADAKEYYEMYKLFEVGQTQLEVCLGETCIGSNGFAQSNQFPICPEFQDPICGDNVVNQESEECDGFSGVGKNQECTDNCALINTTYCGDNIVQEPNDDGMYEECDGSAPEGYTCSNSCELNNAQCEESICDLAVSCDGEITEGDCRSCRTVTCENQEGASTILACEKPDEPPQTYFEMYLIDQQGNGPEVCLGETCVNPKYTGFARSEQDAFVCEEPEPFCGDGTKDNLTIEYPILEKKVVEIQLINLSENFSIEIGNPFEEISNQIEECDDGNNENGDGCNEFCMLEDPILTVIKMIVNDDGGNATVSDWDYMINNTIVQNGSANELLPGSYIVHEILTSPLDVGYSATFSGDCNVNGSVDLGYGDNKTCIITNDDIGEVCDDCKQPAYLTVIKQVINDNKGNTSADEFVLIVSNGSEQVFVNNSEQNEFEPGEYQVSELDYEDYILVGIEGDCNENGTVTLAPGDNKTCVFVNDDLACEIAHRTQTQGGWGNTANGNNPGSYRDANFQTAFPSGVMIGLSDSRFAEWTSSAAIEAFLPAGGPKGALTVNSTNATSTTSGTLAGQTLAATLSVGFDEADANFSNSTTPLANLVLNSGTCIGMSVQEVLDEANQVLAGQPSALSASDVNDCLATINENFVDGTTDEGNLACEVLLA